MKPGLLRSQLLETGTVYELSFLTHSLLRGSSKTKKHSLKKRSLHVFQKPIPAYPMKARSCPVSVRLSQPRPLHLKNSHIRSRKKHSTILYTIPKMLSVLVPFSKLRENHLAHSIRLLSSAATQARGKATS